MPFDTLGILRNGLVALAPAEAAAVAVTVDANGAYAVDIKQTGVRGLAAVMFLPTEPTTYADTLTASIEASDHLDRNWETVASFPVLTALVRKVKLIATTGFAIADITGTMLEGTTSDAGVVLAYDEALATADGIGYVTYAMVDALDIFASLTETVTAGTTGVGTEQGEVALVVPTVGIYVARFATDKRYVRGLYTVSAGGAFGLVACFLGDQDFQRW